MKGLEQSEIKMHEVLWRHKEDTTKVKKYFPSEKLPENLVFNFWKEHQTRLPVLSRVAQDLALMQPTSAAAERVFALFRKNSRRQMKLVASELNLAQL